MRVDVGIGHDDDLVVAAGLTLNLVLMHAAAKGPHRSSWIRLECCRRRPQHVQDLALELAAAPD
jgi:hypothetical protein